jgi:hypothetical protein
MAIKDLTNEEMVGLSGSWVGDKTTNKLLSVHRRTAGMAEDLEAAHAELVRTQGASATKNAELTRLIEEQGFVDGRHDRKARGVNQVLSALAELADGPELRSSILEARDLLFPDGLFFINQNYSAEAGVAEVTRHRLAGNKEVSALLAALPSLEKRSLADEVASWLDAGDQLRQLEVRRRQLTDQGSVGESPVDRSLLVRARNRWIRVVNALTDQINLDDTPDEKLQQAILNPLTEALSRAEGRAKKASKTTPPPPPPNG